MLFVFYMFVSVIRINLLYITLFSFFSLLYTADLFRKTSLHLTPNLCSLLLSLSWTVLLSLLSCFTSVFHSLPLPSVSDFLIFLLSIRYYKLVTVVCIYVYYAEPCGRPVNFKRFLYYFICIYLCIFVTEQATLGKYLK